MTNKNLVMAGKPKVGGAIFRAPLGTALPTDATTKLGAEFKELGYISSDGVTRSINKGYETVNAWGGDEVMKSRSEHSVAFSFTLIESLNEESQKAKWGEAQVSATEATSGHGKQLTVAYDGADTPPAVWVIDMEDQGKLHRIVFPNALDTTEGFEQTFSDEDVVGLPFEMTAFKDAKSGKFFFDYTDDGAKSA